jgi:arylsulfatase A-like enzyme
MIARLLPWLCLLALHHVQGREPNVIFILTDNQGEWSLGCYGNKDIRTPNIDRLASEGVRFAHCFANNPVCSPNRATLLTGLMPSQHGVHSYLGKGPPQTGEGAHSVLSEFHTLGEIFKGRGYACGMVGKWHLGGNESPQEGFTDHWITMPTGSTGTFFNADVIENGVTRKEPTHLTLLWRQQALQFIEQSKDKPFFLYLPFNGPYGLGPAQEKDHERAPHWADYADAPMKSFPRTSMHEWQFNNKTYLNNEVCIRRYAAEVTTIDDGVGEIMAKLETLGLSENTLIVFAGDNGWSGGHHGLWGMGDHTRPKCAFDPTMTVPLIWWQKGVINSGVCESYVSHRDFFPSMLGHLGIKADLPAVQKLTGHDYSAALRGGKLSDWDDTMYYEFEDLRCVRTPNAKLIERFKGPLNEFYDLRRDPAEEHNLIDDATKKPILDELVTKLHTFFEANAAPKFDLWKGGESKAPRLEKEAK